MEREEKWEEKNMNGEISWCFLVVYMICERILERKEKW